MHVYAFLYACSCICLLDLLFCSSQRPSCVFSGSWVCPKPITDSSVTTDHMFQGQMNCDHTSLQHQHCWQPCVACRKSLKNHYTITPRSRISLLICEHDCEVKADKLGVDLRPYSCFELLGNTSALSENLHWISKGYSTVTTHLHEAITACMQSMWLSATVLQFSKDMSQVIRQ